MGNCCDAAPVAVEAELTTESPDFTIETGEGGGLLLNQKWFVKANQTVSQTKVWLDQAITEEVGPGQCLTDVSMLKASCTKKDFDQIMLVVKDRKHDNGLKSLAF